MARFVIDVYAPRPNGRVTGRWTLHDVDNAMSDTEMLQYVRAMVQRERHGGERGYLDACLDRGNYAVVR